jgi:multimeric flavodoxin WrbA
VRTLLVVHHTTSPPLHAMLDAVLAGARHPDIEGVDVAPRAALAATAVDALGADGYLLGTPANLGSMAGALKHFFDQVYYPCIEETVGRPYALYVHGGNDTGGAIRGVEKIATGLRWRKVAEPLSVIGPPSKDDLAACRELGGTVAANLI